MLKRFIFSIFILNLFLNPFLNSIHAKDLMEVGDVDKFDVKYTQKVDTLKGSLFVDNAMDAQNQINEQQKADMEDIENIWNAAVENNQMIAFCLKKLAIPSEQRRIHSSLMAKSVSALISGAALLPSFLGMNYGIQSGAYAAGRLANGLINKENNQKLENPSITDTEAIELASLIEDLQDEIIVDYYNYKGALLKLKKCREQLLLQNKNYSEALSDNNLVDISIASSEWDEGLIEEYKLKQEVKKYYYSLSRLAGKKTIENLNIAQYDLVTQNVDKNELNFEKKLLPSKASLSDSGGKK